MWETFKGCLPSSLGWNRTGPHLCNFPFKTCHRLQYSSNRSCHEAGWRSGSAQGKTVRDAFIFFMCLSQSCLCSFRILKKVWYIGCKWINCAFSEVTNHKASGGNQVTKVLVVTQVPGALPPVRIKTLTPPPTSTAEVVVTTNYTHTREHPNTMSKRWKRDTRRPVTMFTFTQRNLSESQWPV